MKETYCRWEYADLPIVIDIDQVHDFFYGDIVIRLDEQTIRSKEQFESRSGYAPYGKFNSLRLEIDERKKRIISCEYFEEKNLCKIIKIKYFDGPPSAPLPRLKYFELEDWSNTWYMVYNKYGNISEVCLYQPDGTLWETRKYEYTEKGYLSRVTHENHENGKKREFRYEYDESCEWDVSKMFYYEDGELIRRVEYLNEYENRLWLEKKGLFNFITARGISTTVIIYDAQGKKLREFNL